MTLRLAAAGLLALSACASAPGTASSGDADATANMAAETIRAEAIEAHIRFLASDLLEGREAGTKGYDIAASYMANQFRLLGLEPGGSDGYYDAVPLEEMRALTDAARFEIEGEALEYGEDYLVSTHAELDESLVTGEAVFAGYGIDMEELGLDSYAGVDVEGKIAVVLFGTPDGLPSDVAAHLNNSATKAEMAAENGAAGLVYLAAEGLTRFPFERLAAFSGRPSTSTPAAEPDPRIKVRATLSTAGAEALFAGTPIDLESLIEAARAGETLDAVALGKTVTLAQATERSVIESDNVIAVLPGSDPSLAGEVVVVTAHLDHIGICRPEGDEDRICNGALDNASGSAIMLETARALSRGETPARPVAFVALTAEEKGLLGAAHLAANPAPGTRGAVANVNLDMPVIRYRFNDLIAFGAEHSSLGPIAEAAAARAGASITPDPLPDQALFVRSDHYEYVRRGVPALFLMTGFSSPDEADDEGQGFLRFLGGDYHAPGDETDTGILFEQGAKFARINYEIISAIANGEETPAWNADSPFGGQ